jgi:uncharacterized protein
MAELPDDLATPDVELEETHISWVFLGERDVYKVKKPLDLEFLDFSSAAARRRACEAEVTLNRRLAPGVYRGVVPITVGPDGRLRIGGDGEPVDWAVHMRRLPAARRADHLLHGNRLSRDALTLVAERLAAFHAAARCDPAVAVFGSPEAIDRNVRENFQHTRGTVEAYLSAAEAAEIERWQLDFLTGRRALLEQRVRAGRIRDGHGDLRLEHLYLLESDLERRQPAGAAPTAIASPPRDGAPAPPGGALAGGSAPGTEVVIVDCIEFNDRFRYADVCADAAFLSMDLAAHGAVDLAEHFLARYARAANDFDLYPLVDFYQSYRACVRGKVASIVAADEGAAAGARARAAAEAHRHFKLALASERPSLLPSLVIAVGGPIASGKSTVAEWIAHERSAPIVDADRTRKSMLGVAPTEKVWHPPFSGSYAPEVTAQVYDEILRRARAVLDSGRAVVLDASFRSRDERAAARRLAAECSVGFLFVECAAPAPTLRRRLEERQRRTGVSDGRLEILEPFLASWEPVTELHPAEHARLDTDRPFEEARDLLRSRIAFWPPRLAG